MGEFQIGGQAVIEGVMMRGANSYSIAVRTPDGKIISHTEKISSLMNKIPLGKSLLRGLAVLIESLILGIRSLTYSANLNISEEDKEQGVELSASMLIITIIIALAFGLGLFVFLPIFFTKLLDKFLHNTFLYNLIEGLIRIGIFLLYLFFISFLKDIKRVFQYHGAEHKSIHALEARDLLTQKSVSKYTTLHPGCGTSFVLIVLVIAIFVFALMGRPPILLRIALQTLAIPVIAGISYEIIRLSRRYKNSVILKIFIRPGLWFQKLTTKEPDLNQIEVALVALKNVLEMEKKIAAS